MRSFGQFESELKVWIWMTTDAGVLPVPVALGSTVPEEPVAEAFAGSAG